MIHPSTELKFINETVGYGVVATDFIPKGTITWALDLLDRVFIPDEVNSMNIDYQRILDTYAYRNSQGNYILCWDHARFVNHSFKSNCLTTAYDFEISIKDIHPGHQLTDDYGYLNICTPFRGIDEGTKRKIVYPNDLEKYSNIWDKKLRDSFKFIPIVAQPLKNYIGSETWDEVLQITAGVKTMKSIFTNYYKGNSGYS